MPNRDLKVTLVGVDNTGSAFGSAARNADGLDTKFSGLGRTVAAALGGVAVAGIAGLGAAFAQGVRDAASYEKITDQVAQTIQSTGGAAGVTADGLKAYAGQLESISGVDEELILSGQNVLLTFTNIRNGVGEGNDIFDQASEAALNLSTTMGGDLVGANTLVGKALNDPIAGMTALRRAGVQLTDAQQAQVTAMVESGDVLGAQKVLLGELEVQFGGAAKAAGEGLTGSIARAKDAFQDMFRELATALLPTLTSLATWFAETGIPALSAFGGWVKDNANWLVPLAGAIASVVAVVKAWSIAQGILNVVMAANPFVLIAAAVIGLVAVVVANWDTIVSWTKTAWSAVTSAVSAAWQWIKNAVKSGIDFLVNLFLNFTGPGLIIKHWDSIVAFTRNAWNAITGAVSGAWRSITGAISSGVSTAVSWVAGLPGRLLGALGNLGSLLWNAGADLINGFINGIKNMVGRVASAALDVARSAVNAVKDFLGINSPSRVFAGLGQNVGQGFVQGMASMRPAVAAEMARMADTQALGGLGGLSVGRSSSSMLGAGTRSSLTSVGATAMGSGDSRPAIHIENYNEARRSPHEVAEDLTFIGRTRG